MSWFIIIFPTHLVIARFDGDDFPGEFVVYVYDSVS